MKTLKARLFAVGLLASALVATSAQAAIDASVGTAFTALQTDAQALATLVTPIVVAVLGMFLVIKLIKKFGNKI